LRQLDIEISANTVARLLRDMDFSLRVNRKAIATDSSPDRDQQFRYISSLRTRFQRRGLPIISVDTKKRELVGNFKNNGVKWDRTPVRVNDHDFRSDAIGVAIPYGIYDLLANRGSVFVGVSHDTAAFAAHSIAGWWKRDGADRYRRGRQLLILADTGGSNSCRTGAENRASNPTLQQFWAHRNRCSLPNRRFQVESHRAPPVFRNLQKLGRRASRHLPQSPQLHP
jgi:DDE family transposase